MAAKYDIYAIEAGWYRVRPAVAMVGFWRRVKPSSHATGHADNSGFPSAVIQRILSYRQGNHRRVFRS
jgi:hypothetical protein